jgi:hypothetical protein
VGGVSTREGLEGPKKSESQEKSGKSRKRRKTYHPSGVWNDTTSFPSGSLLAIRVQNSHRAWLKHDAARDDDGQIQGSDNGVPPAIHIPSAIAARRPGRTIQRKTGARFEGEGSRDGR